MTLLDIHTHLDHPKFSADLDKVIQRAKQNNVNIIVTNGVNPETNRKSLEIAKKYSIQAALGIYPVEALAKEIKAGEYPIKLNEFDIDEEINFILKQAKANKLVVAIGEVGLDDYSVKGKLQPQIKVFEKLISVAEKTKKPIIVHSRKAEQQCVDILSSSKLKPEKIIMHCFSADQKLIKKASDLGFNFSIPTNVVFSEHFQNLVKAVNINQLFTETDAPYLGPVKGERNEPANIIYSIKKIAEIKGFDAKETENTIMMNYQRVFG